MRLFLHTPPPHPNLTLTLNSLESLVFAARSQLSPSPLSCTIAHLLHPVPLHPSLRIPITHHKPALVCRGQSQPLQQVGSFRGQFTCERGCKHRWCRVTDCRNSLSCRKCGHACVPVTLLYFLLPCSPRETSWTIEIGLSYYLLQPNSTQVYLWTMQASMHRTLALHFTRCLT